MVWKCPRAVGEVPCSEGGVEKVLLQRTKWKRGRAGKRPEVEGIGSEKRRKGGETVSVGFPR